VLPTNIIATAEAENNGELYTINLNVNGHSLIADELTDKGGLDLGPAPGDYICMSLASCTVITLRMYANRKGWNLEKIHAKVNLISGKVLPSGNNTFYVELSFSGDLTDEQRQRLMEIADACPVHRLLKKPNDIITMLA
jgi:putative redox protein